MQHFSDLPLKIFYGSHKFKAVVRKVIPTGFIKLSVISCAKEKTKKRIGKEPLSNKFL